MGVSVCETAERVLCIRIIYVGIRICMYVYVCVYRYVCWSDGLCTVLVCVCVFTYVFTCQ